MAFNVQFPTYLIKLQCCQSCQQISTIQQLMACASQGSNRWDTDPAYFASHPVHHPLLETSDRNSPDLTTWISQTSSIIYQNHNIIISQPIWNLNIFFCHVWLYPNVEVQRCPFHAVFLICSLGIHTPGGDGGVLWGRDRKAHRSLGTVEFLCCHQRDDRVGAHEIHQVASWCGDRHGVPTVSALPIATQRIQPEIATDNRKDELHS